MTQRIFLHTPEPASSSARYVAELARALTHLAVPVHVIGPTNHQARAAFERNPLITFHPSGRRSTSTRDSFVSKIFENARFLLSSCSVLLRTVRAGDIVHFQFVLHFPFGALFFLCALLRRCKIVFTVHDPLPHKWLLPISLRRLEIGALAWSYRSSDVLLVHSESGRRVLQQHFPRVADKIRVIVHGPYELDSLDLALPRSSFLEVLLFGSLRENKGAHLAIAAIQQLHGEGAPIRLTIAGSVLNRKERAYWDRCRDLIAQCPDPIRVIEKFIPDEDLPELFENCHCFLLPYTHFSSDSGVAFMALANGRPIITTKVGGLASLLESSRCGVPIHEPTVSSVASALRAAVNLGTERLDQLGRAGKAWVLEECGWPKVASQTRQVYESLRGAFEPAEGNEYSQPAIFN